MFVVDSPTQHTAWQKTRDLRNLEPFLSGHGHAASQTRWVSKNSPKEMKSESVRQKKKYKNVHLCRWQAPGTRNDGPWGGRGGSDQHDHIQDLDLGWDWLPGVAF